MSLMDHLRRPTPTARPWKDLTLPTAVHRVKSMLTSEEKQYLFWLTAERYEGWGEVVDLGPWLGSSSVALAEGLRRRRSSAKVRSFDVFQGEPSYMESVAPTGPALGDDFLPLFLREVADNALWIDARKQDLASIFPRRTRWLISYKQ